MKLLATTALLAASVNAFQTCGGDQSFVQSFNAERTNNLIKFTIVGQTKNEIQHPVVNIQTSAVGIPLTQDVIDLCALDHIQCPIPANTAFELQLEHNLPEEVPASVDLDITAKAVNDEDLLYCTNGKIEAQNAMKSAHKNGLVFTSRFGFSENEVGYLFNKWFEHFKDEIPLPVDDLEKRLATFRNNLLHIVFHNAGDHPYTMAMNQFGHMDADEFKKNLLGFKKPTKAFEGFGSLKKDVHEYNGEELPETVDWTTKGAVTNVKNQGACGSCWSFSTTGALEGAYFLKYGKLVSFSEEELVTCDHTDMGCNGGLMDFAFQWIEKNGGLCTEKEVPYVSGGGSMPSCRKNCDIVPNSAPKSYVDVKHNTKSLMSAVAKTPVAIAIEADQGAFQFYSGGVLTGACGTQLDHGVLLVGYGTEDGVDYWKVKNSWGGTWGDQGYIKLQRGKHQFGGECGILNSASYPVL